MDRDIAVRVRVTGQVQGVFFRDGARREARRLGVAGWVRNEPDGSVAVHAEGSQGDVDALVDWCRTGPAAAEVAEVTTEVAETTGEQDFAVRS